MTIVLSHNTALELLRAIPPQSGLLATVEKDVPSDQLELPCSAGLFSTLSRFGIGQNDVHVLGPRRCRKSRSRRMQTHAASCPELPGSLLRQLEPGLLVAGPELCFIQMARQVSLVGAVVLGHELCGSYSHFFRLVSGFYERPALTSVEKILSALDGLSGAYGAASAREALAWARDGSRSPMETVVSCEFFLPPSLGGFGFVSPALNHGVALDAAASQMTRTSYCYVDVAYPDLQLGFEYDSSQFHHDPARDRRRREALQHMGWRIVTIELDHMTDHNELLRTISLVKDVIPRVSEAWPDAGETLLLHRRLLRATRCGLGLSAALFAPAVASLIPQVHV